jgi:hypothetical protein
MRRQMPWPGAGDPVGPPHDCKREVAGIAALPRSADRAASRRVIHSNDLVERHDALGAGRCAASATKAPSHGAFRTPNRGATKAPQELNAYARPYRLNRPRRRQERRPVSASAAGSQLSIRRSSQNPNVVLRDRFASPYAAPRAIQAPESLHPTHIPDSLRFLR